MRRLSTPSGTAHIRESARIDHTDYDALAVQNRYRGRQVPPKPEAGCALRPRLASEARHSSGCSPWGDLARRPLSPLHISPTCVEGVKAHSPEVIKRYEGMHQMEKFRIIPAVH